MRNNKSVGKQPTGHRPISPIQYTISDLTIVLRAGQTKIREWIDKKKLLSYKIDGTVFVTATDAEAFVDRYRESALAHFKVSEN